MTLFDAVEAADLQALNAALREGQDVNVVGPQGRTPLLAAAAAGKTALVQRLLDAGAEPGWKDEAQETALLVAAANGHAETCRVLAPHAAPDERDQAAAYLKAFGDSRGPAYDLDPGAFAKAAATTAARAANFFGDEAPLKRLERADKAKKGR